MPRLALAEIDGKGRCVFAAEKIAKGTWVTSDPIVRIPKQHLQALVDAKSPIGSYPFAWTDDHHAIVLGLTSLANHSDNPNCHTSRQFGKQLLGLVAKRDIEPGEELTYDYKVPLWFEPKPDATLNLKEGT
jgi:SET domain-containing protein